MKRLLTLFVMLCVMGFMAFAGGQSEAQGEKEITIKLGHIRATNHPTHEGALKFAELVKERTDGRITINVFANSQLGGIQEMFTQVNTGDLEMVYGGINTYGFIEGGDAFEITAIPFLYRDYEHMLNALKADFFDPVFEEAEEKTGIKVMNIGGDTAPRGLSANRPIRKPADFEGLKIRTAASEVVIRAMKGLGALPQQIPFSDLYVALKTGTVDAQENGAIVVADNSLYEVQDYYMKTDYIRDIETFYINPEFWNSLSEEDQEIMLNASEEAGQLVTELTNERLDAAYEKLEEEITVIRPPELDLEAVRAELEGTYSDWDGTKWPEGLLEKIRNM
ncbi:MAG: TRAP transporter substrate-binding protein [Spirochaetaceae bacterium]|nr:TRAP transporter substrate-binding protein [Spirochaetaceae bacterium]MCF7949772.1 TRAP transporter substrate-binding protein [Spirochaetia bacterium]MCF7952143.1 TRAP transporter substrate-binding protein [Spirochaetaceae bacterium]